MATKEISHSSETDTERLLRELPSVPLRLPREIDFDGGSDPDDDDPDFLEQGFMKVFDAHGALIRHEERKKLKKFLKKAYQKTLDAQSRRCIFVNSITMERCIRTKNPRKSDPEYCAHHRRYLNGRQRKTESDPCPATYAQKNKSADDVNISDPKRRCVNNRGYSNNNNNNNNNDDDDDADAALIRRFNNLRRPVITMDDFCFGTTSSIPQPDRQLAPQPVPIPAPEPVPIPTPEPVPIPVIIPAPQPDLISDSFSDTEPLSPGPPPVIISGGFQMFGHEDAELISDDENYEEFEELDRQEEERKKKAKKAKKAKAKKNQYPVTKREKFVTNLRQGSQKMDID